MTEDGFVSIHHGTGDAGPGCQLRRLGRSGIDEVVCRFDQRFGFGGMFGVAISLSSQQILQSRQLECIGLRETANVNPAAMRLASDSLGNRSIRAASAIAASTIDGSFNITRASNGVLDRGRSAVHSSRLGASIALSIGCRNWRCQ